jgi:hypothetical protein
MNSELNRLIDAITKYNLTYWIIYKGKSDKIHYCETNDIETAVSELKEAYSELEEGKYTFKARAGKSDYNSQLVRDFQKGGISQQQNGNNTMDTQALIMFSHTLAEIKLRQEQMHDAIKTIAESVLKLHDTDKTNDSDGLSMLKTLSEGAKVVGSLKDLFPNK